MRIAGALIVLGACGWGCAGAADLPEVPEAAVNELGVTPGTPQMNGFVFVEGRYLAPPYTVSRKGNALFVNRIQFEQPVAWSRFEESKTPETKAIDADGDFQKVEDAPAKPAAANKIDDLFADNGAQTNDAHRAASDEKTVAEPRRSPEELKQVKDELRKSLDGRRKAYEAALGRGEVFFFGQRHNRVNGNYGTARTLMGVLPKALREAQSAQDLLRRLNDGGVFFVDAGICSALFKNKSAFPQLEERLRKILDDEALEAERRKRESR